MEEIGKALVVEPYLDTVVIGGGLLRRWSGARADELIDGIIGGTVRCAFAHLEPAVRFDLADVSTSATNREGALALDGDKDAVVAAPWATHLLVTARTGGRPQGSARRVRVPRCARCAGRIAEGLSDGRRIARLGSALRRARSAS